MAQIQQGKKGGRKIGRNTAKCAAYARACRREMNKIRKIGLHLKRHPNDEASMWALKNIRMIRERIQPV